MGNIVNFVKLDRNFLSCLGPEMQSREDEKCKSGMAIDDSGEACERRAVWAGYCLHYLTYYDKYSNKNGVSGPPASVEYN